MGAGVCRHPCGALVYFISLLPWGTPYSSMDRISSWVPLKPFHIFSNALSHIIPASLLVFLPHNPIGYCWQPLFWRVPRFVLRPRGGGRHQSSPTQRILGSSVAAPLPARAGLRPYNDDGYA